jgi:DNA-directed RNA polymerase subunit E'/Rpb7
MKAQETNDKEKGMKMKIGEFVFAEYDNGEIVNGEVVNVRMFGERVLLTVKAEQGYRSIYTDKCVTLDT